MPQHRSVVLTDSDHAIIEGMLHCEHSRTSSRAFALRRKLAAAAVVPPAEIAPDVVTLHSRVRFSIDGGPAEERTLVASHAEEIADRTVLAWTSRGLAMLGMRAGQQAPLLRLDGTTESLTIEAVLFQPEAQRRAEQAAAFANQRSEGAQLGGNSLRPEPDRPRRTGDVVFGPDGDDWGPGAA